jgi:hypothetical protein
MVGTHTYFPLSIGKILILTNLAWVRNPYQSERKVHPNPMLFRDTIFMFTDIQALGMNIVIVRGKKDTRTISVPPRNLRL